MKKKLLSILLVMVLVLSLAGCGAPKLSGTYSTDMLLSEVTYEFTEDGNVHFELSMGNITLLSKDGTYSINDEGTEITFKFGETSEESKDLPKGMDKLSGTFEFTDADTSIIINSTAYKKISE